MVSIKKNTIRRKDNKRIATGEVIPDYNLEEGFSRPVSDTPLFNHNKTADFFLEKRFGKGDGCKKKVELYGKTIRNRFLNKNSFFNRCVRASMTVEAAMVTPLFVFALTVLISIIMVTGVQMRVRKAVYESVRSASCLPYNLGMSAERTNAKFTKAGALGAVKSFFMQQMSGYTTAAGLIEGGAGGVRITAHLFDREAAAIHVTVHYNAKIPLAFFAGGIIPVEQEVESYAWLGDEFMDSGSKEKIVYITPHGTVYHEDINCTYLKPTVYSESVANVTSLRNAGGEKYRECEACTKKSGITPVSVYITRYGNRYHTNPNCVKIRHEVISVPISKVADRHLCLKEQRGR